MVCAVTSPSALLQIHQRLVSSCNESNHRSDVSLAPSPDKASLDAFLGIVSSHKWDHKRAMHPIFEGHLVEESDFASVFSEKWQRVA